MSRVTFFVPVLLVTSLGLAACGSSTADVATTPSTTAAPAASAPAGTVPAGTRVSANTASTEEITAALAAAGVENPDAWADEVVEHRPYRATDPTLLDLREALAQYDPADGLLDQMVSALTP